MYKLSRKIIGYLLFILITVSNIYGIDKFEPFYVDNDVNNFLKGGSNLHLPSTLVNMALGPNNTMFVIVKGGPFNKNVVRQIDINGKILRTWGKKGTGEGEFMTLSDIVVDNNRGYVYVSDVSNHRIQKYHFNGNFITQWGTQGSQNGQFKSPTRLALDTYGNVYVIDYNNNRVQKFNQNGTFILKFGGAGSGDGRFDMPGNIAVDSHNNIYVVDSEHVQKFNSSSGSFIKKMDVPYPQAVTVDKSGHIYIADYDTIKRYDKDGNFINYLVENNDGTPRKLAVDNVNNIYILGNDLIEKFSGSTQMPIRAWGRYKSDRGEFPYAKGLAFDHHGNFFVADEVNNRIQKFNKKGYFLKQWGKYGHKVGEFKRPTAIAVDSFGNVYVTDQDNHRVQKFNNDGHFIKQWDTIDNGGKFRYPRAIAINKDNDIYVSDREAIHIFTVDGISVDEWPVAYVNAIAINPIDNSVYCAIGSSIKRYTEGGSLITSWGQNGSGAGEFESISSLTVSNNGYVYVSEKFHDDDRIQKFDSNGGYIREYKSTYIKRFSGGLSTDTYGVVYVFSRHTQGGFYPYGRTQIDRLGIRANVDFDGDGVDNNEDAFPRNPKEWLDTDHDGIGNNADTDDDNDGISDSLERANGLNPLNASDAQADFDNDGFSNALEIAAGTSIRNRNNKPIWTPISMGNIITFLPVKP